MNTILVMRHAFTAKPRNVAKYGDKAPRDGYVNTFMEERDEPETPMEWAELENWLEEERAGEHAKLAEWLAGK